MRISLEKATLYSAYLYIMSLYVLAYDTALNLISKGLFLIMCTLFLFDVAKERKIVKNVPICVYLVSFATLAFASCFWSPNFSYTFNRTMTFIQVLILFFIVFNILTDEQKIYSMLTAIFWGGMVMCLYSIIDYGPSYIVYCLTNGIRIGGEINQENAFGLYCTIMVTIGFFKGIYYKQNVYFLCSIIPLVLGVGSGSRKTLLVLMISIVMLFALKSGKIQIKKILGSLFVGIIVFAILYNIEPLQPLFRRFTALLNIFEEEESADFSTLTRLDMIKFGWQSFKQSPILGYGTEGYYLKYLEQFGEMRASHCNYIQILNSFGIVGFSMYYGLYVYIIHGTIKYGFKVNKELAAFVLDMAIISLVSEITTTTLTNKFTFIYLAVMVCFCNITKVRYKERENGINTLKESDSV